MEERREGTVEERREGTVEERREGIVENSTTVCVCVCVCMCGCAGVCDALLVTLNKWAHPSLCRTFYLEWLCGL